MRWAALRVFVGFMGLHGALVTVRLTEAARSGEVTIIVDPFHTAFRPFQTAVLLFPQRGRGRWKPGC